MRSSSAGPSSPPEAALTPGESEVALLAASGMSIAAIAGRRASSRHTVANQLTAIYRKLGVGGRRELRARLAPPATPGTGVLRAEICAGRWSLVDCVERDGRRYFLARRNDARLARARALSPRERQVWLAAASGQSNKLIAFVLGLCTPTVATHLDRARRKLGGWANHWFWLK